MPFSSISISICWHFNNDNQPAKKNIAAKKKLLAEHVRSLNTAFVIAEAPRKPELIIRESQPAELPPDVIRSSDKSDLGLSELHQLNVKERYNVFEHAKKDEPQSMLDREERILKRGTTVLSKLAKYLSFQFVVSLCHNGYPLRICIA